MSAPVLPPNCNFNGSSKRHTAAESLSCARMDNGEPMPNGWIQEKALEIGLEGNQFVGALAYAGNEGWLADAPQTGWTLLTSAGVALGSIH
jgi:hypothetical protein